MPTRREKRLAKERGAADFVEKHHGPMAALLEDVSAAIGAELVGLPQAQADARLAAEMAYRLDKAIAIPNELAEALDWFGFFLGSLLVIGIVRGIERSAKRRKQRRGNLKTRLEEKGPRMTRIARRSLERRIKALQTQLDG